MFVCNEVRRAESACTCQTDEMNRMTTRPYQDANHVTFRLSISDHKSPTLLLKPEQKRMSTKISYFIITKNACSFCDNGCVMSRRVWRTWCHEGSAEHQLEERRCERSPRSSPCAWRTRLKSKLKCKFKLKTFR
jgi:hypothetical protein